MAECLGCATVYRLRITRCPRCHGTEFEEMEMPKITRHGGPSYEGEAGPDGPENESEEFAARLDDQLVGEADPDALPEAVEGDHVEREHPGTGQPMTAIEGPADGTEHELVTEPNGGEEPSPGSSSTTSSPTPTKSSEPSKTAPQKRARSTGSRSRPAPAESSSAASTDGSTPGTGSTPAEPAK